MLQKRFLFTTTFPTRGQLWSEYSLFLSSFPLYFFLIFFYHAKKRAKIRKTVSQVNCIIIHCLDRLPTHNIFSSTQNRRNSRRCHIFDRTSLEQIDSAVTTDLFLITTSEYNDSVQCYKLLCPVYLRQDPASVANKFISSKRPSSPLKQTPPELFEFVENEIFTQEKFYQQLTMLDRFFEERRQNTTSTPSPSSHPNLKFYSGMSWQDAFLMLEITTTSLFLGSLSSAKDHTKIKEIDTLGTVLDKNRYDLAHLYQLLNIYNFNILVTFMIWYLLTDKRNMVFSNVWQTTLENIFIYDLWYTMTKIRMLLTEALTTGHQKIQSFQRLAVKSTLTFANEINLGPFQRLAYFGKPYTVKRLKHQYRAPLTRNKQTNFSTFDLIVKKNDMPTTIHPTMSVMSSAMTDTNDNDNTAAISSINNNVFFVRAQDFLPNDNHLTMFDIQTTTTTTTTAAATTFNSTPLVLNQQQQQQQQPYQSSCQLLTQPQQLQQAEYQQHVFSTHDLQLIDDFVYLISDRDLSTPSNILHHHQQQQQYQQQH